MLKFASLVCIEIVLFLFFFCDPNTQSAQKLSQFLKLNNELIETQTSVFRLFIVSYRCQFVRNVQHSLSIKMLKYNLIEQLRFLRTGEYIFATRTRKICVEISVYGFANFRDCAVRLSMIGGQSLDRVTHFSHCVFQHLYLSGCKLMIRRSYDKTLRILFHVLFSIRSE